MAETIVVVDHPLAQHKLTHLRRRDSSTSSFRRLMREIGMMLACEVTRDLPLEMTEIETPLAKMTAPVLSGRKPVLIPVLRAGCGLVDGMLEVIPSARVGHIGIYREPSTLQAVEYFLKVPPALGERLVIVADPMLATGHTAVAAVQRLKDAGAKAIRFVCVVASPEGIGTFQEAHPDIPVFTLAVDEKLDEHGYIVAGLGDAGDRLFGTL